MKSQKERDEGKRREKLDEMQAQIESGSLVVRKMTAAERKRFPARERKRGQKRS